MHVTTKLYMLNDLRHMVPKRWIYSVELQRR